VFAAALSGSATERAADGRRRHRPHGTRPHWTTAKACTSPITLSYSIDSITTDALYAAPRLLVERVSYVIHDTTLLVRR
jgi:hypothetical protein